MKNGPNIAACSALLLLVIVWPAAARTWTSRDGKLTVEAELVDFGSESVHLKKQNAQIITVPLSKLSKSDRDYIASLAASKDQSKKATSPNDADAEKAAKEKLRSRGIRALITGLALTDETKLTKGLRGIHQVRKRLDRAGKILATLQGQEVAIESAIALLTQQNVRLNAQLANLRSGDVTTNNRLVGAISANAGRIQLHQRALQQLGEKTQAAHSAANEAREAYIQAILDLRKLADSISSQYQSKAAESGVKAAIDQLNQATGKSYALTPSRKFQIALKRLKSLEETVLSESIQLRRSSGGTLLASVVINGKHTQEMIVDSGAGSGRPLAWKLAGAGIGPAPRATPVLLAGGLTPANVARAIERVGPDGVDASSGLESAPGVKNTTLVEAFVEAAKSAAALRAAVR